MTPSPLALTLSLEDSQVRPIGVPNPTLPWSFSAHNFCQPRRPEGDCLSGVFILWVRMGVGGEQCLSLTSPAAVGLVERTGLHFAYTGENSYLATAGTSSSARSPLNSLCLKFFAFLPASVSVGAATVPARSRP